MVVFLLSPEIKANFCGVVSPGCRYNKTQRCCRCCRRRVLLPSALRVSEDRELIPSPWSSSSFLLKIKENLWSAASRRLHCNRRKYCSPCYGRTACLPS